MQLFLHQDSKSDDFDLDQELVIIGSGPAGLTAAIYASRGQLNPLVEDYKLRGYSLKKAKILIGDITREILAFLP